ncbi:MAG: lipoprotein-releasing ABC transporter permease subunit [Pseudomonadota bacterium]
MSDMPYEINVGSRYVKTRGGSGFVSFISAISMLGVAIGVAVLIIVLSVVNGFERELTDRLLAMSSHATIEGLDDRLTAWELRREDALQNPRVVAGAPYVEDRALLAGSETVSGIVVRGVLPAEEASVADLDVIAPDGSVGALESRAYQIVLGDALAKALDVAVGDRVTLMVAEGTVTPAGILPRMRRFTVSGVFRAGMYEFDRRYAFIHLDDARRLLRLRDDVTGLRLAVTDMFEAPAIAREVAIAQGGGVMISDWTRRHRAFFRSIQVTKSILFVILSLVVAVAAFNIVSTLVMVVRNKRADIAILRTLGASRRGILSIFVSQGSVIGVAGAISGVLIGTLVSLNLEMIVAGVERVFDITLLAEDVYFISDLPSELRLGDVGFVVAIALALVFAATVYPAWRASRTNPAEELRFD